MVYFTPAIAELFSAIQLSLDQRCNSSYVLERCDSRQLSFCLFRNLNQILVTDGVMNNSCVFLFVNSIQSLLLISSKHCPWLHFGAIAHHKTFRPLNILSFLPFICTNLDPESSIKNFPVTLLDFCFSFIYQENMLWDDLSSAPLFGFVDQKGESHILKYTFFPIT